FRQPEKVLAEIAYHFDYFDPAHFNHDFRKTVGVSPQVFFETESEQFRSILDAQLRPNSR
ncbi:MAG: hypothetical protein AAFQ98_20360, partial [Bacteroidota bacterium]